VTPRAELISLPALSEWQTRFLGVGIAIAACVLALGLLSWLMPRLMRRVSRSAQGPRFRQRQTAASLLASSLRYVVVLAALIAIFILLAGGGALGAVSGAALVLVLVSFASQRLLGDVIAGFFVLFEDQYAVGDVVRLEPSGVSGVVAELGLRATVIRDANGDLCHVPNGQITAVRRAPSAGRTLRLLALTRDPDELEALVPALGPAVPGATLKVTGRSELGGRVWAVAIQADVLPNLDGPAEENLIAALKARAGDVLLADPSVTGHGPLSRPNASGVAE
jgi:moderate conductance mechanosensitive channel